MRDAQVTEPERRTADWEDLIAGRALAWVGAAATLLGIVLLLVMAAARGWIGEEARVEIAAALSTALLIAGGRLFERRGRTDAAAAMTAVGVLGLHGALVAAASVYGLIAPLPALTVATLLAAVTVALCLRWQEVAVARITLLGALCAPVALGATGEVLTFLFLAVLFAGVAAVCVQRDWGWLGLAAYVLVTPQWVGILETTDGVTTGGRLAALVAFAMLGVATAVGLELREHRPTLRRPAVFLLALNALVAAGVGYALLGGDALAKGWLAGLAVAHLAGGLLVRTPRVGADLRFAAVTLGVLLGDLAAVALLDGAALALAWTASTVAFALLNRLAGDERPLLGGGLALHTYLAVGQLLLLHEEGTGSVALVAVVAAACLASGQISRAGWRVALQATGLALVAYGTALAVEGVALALAFAAEAVVLARLSRSDDAPAAAGAAVGFLGLGGLVALDLTGARALVDGVGDPLTAAVVLGAVALATGLAAAFLTAPVRAPLGTAAVIGALYLASVELVTLAGTSGQVALSAFWAAAGVVGLIAGLRRDLPLLRGGSFALLGVAAGKVALYDLAALSEIQRVASCIALGLLLLVGAFVWQRLRPRAPTDLRAMPAALR